MEKRFYNAKLGTMLADLEYQEYNRGKSGTLEYIKMGGSTCETEVKRYQDTVVESHYSTILPISFPQNKISLVSHAVKWFFYNKVPWCYEQATISTSKPLPWNAGQPRQLLLAQSVLPFSSVLAPVHILTIESMYPRYCMVLSNHTHVVADCHDKQHIL